MWFVGLASHTLEISHTPQARIWVVEFCLYGTHVCPIMLTQEVKNV